MSMFHRQRLSDVLGFSTVANDSDRNALYRERYGAWTGFPKGNAPNYELCCKEIWSRERWSRHSQCTRPRGHGPDKAYCKQHDPEAVKARSAASRDRWNQKTNQERYKWYGPTFFDALRQIAEGHNDACGLAQKVIEEFMKGQN